MAEFEIEREALRREARFRVVSWGIVLLLLAVTVFLFALRASGRLSANSDLRFLAAFTLLATVIGAGIVAFREALHRAERQMVFVLDDKAITQRRKGYPDVRIAFSEIGTLREELRWLIIETAESQKKIGIPNDVSGYEAIRAELAKHHPLSARMGLAKLPLKTFALPAVAILSWTAVVWFRGAVALVPGVVGLITVAIGSHSMWTVLHRRLWRPVLWAAIASAWLTAILLIYFRVTAR